MTMFADNYDFISKVKRKLRTMNIMIKQDIKMKYEIKF